MPIEKFALREMDDFIIAIIAVSGRIPHRIDLGRFTANTGPDYHKIETKTRGKQKQSTSTLVMLLQKDKVE